MATEEWRFKYGKRLRQGDEYQHDGLWHISATGCEAGRVALKYCWLLKNQAKS